MQIDKLAKRYTGGRADLYEKERKGSGKWEREHKAVETFLREIDADGSIETVLDVPVGTGRFFPLYRELSFNVIGYDVSRDMLQEARQNVCGEKRFELRHGDVFKLDVRDVNCEAIVCIRFVNWLKYEDFERLLEIFSALVPRYIIISIRSRVETEKPEEVELPSKSFDPAGRLWEKSIRVLREEGLEKFVRSGVRVIRKKIQNNQARLIIHPREKVERAIRSNGYLIRNRHLVDHSIDGRELNIYLLEKRE